MNDKGFTLVELMVSVGIIGLLAAIAIPEFKEYRKKAYDAQAISALRTVEQALVIMDDDCDTGALENPDACDSGHPKLGEGQATEHFIKTRVEYQ